MTIGIAAYGERAGLAVVEGLRTAEAVGRGALHGFVSLVTVGADGRLRRAEVQDGGSARLFAGGGLPRAFAESTCAGLMSSGPNRPTPLSQFTPAEAGVGLVTGHRFPNMPGPDGVPLNLAVLHLMRQGLTPQAAVAAVVASNPTADAGLIALSRDGRLAASNTDYVSGFGDAGQALGQTPEGTSRIAVLHNAIRPHRTLAPLIVEVALAVMRGTPQREAVIMMSAGLPLSHGSENAIEIDDAGEVLGISVRDQRCLGGAWSLGLGYRAPIRRRGALIGTALYEPYLRVDNGIVVSIDGGASASVPVSLLGA